MICCRYLQNRTRVVVWLYENVNTWIEGQIVGFDEYMNLVLDEATEEHTKRNTSKPLGRRQILKFKPILSRLGK